MRRTAAAFAVALLLGAGAIAAAPGAAAASVPGVKAVAPATGSAAGGGRVTITGSHFARGITVSFGKSRGSSVHLVSSTKLLVTSPAHAAGAVDVTVHTAAGTSTKHRSDRFTFVSPPSVGAVSPAHGTGAGGTRVTVTGHGFSAVTAVRFGTIAGRSVKVLSSTKLQVTTPAQPSGTHDVRVVNRYGASRVTAVDHFAFTTAFDAPTAVGMDSSISVNVYGLRPGSFATVVLDGAYSLGSAKASLTGQASLGVAMTGQVADGVHELRINGTDGAGKPATFTSPLRIDVVAPVLDTVTAPTDPVHSLDVITLRVHATDEGGVKYVIIEVGPPSGSTPCHNPSAQLESGTATDGVWAMTCTLPANMPPGEYQIYPWGADLADNLVNLDDQGSTSMGTFTVAS